jgi:hypothetical protein
MKNHFILLYKHQEMAELVNFSTIKGMTSTKKRQKAFGGPPNIYINLEMAAVV